MEEFIAWISQYPWDPLIIGDMEVCTDFLESKGLYSPSSESSTIGCVGFCWGAWVVAKTLHAASSSSDYKWSSSVKCGVGLHPSTHIEKNAYKRDEDKMLQEITSPFLLLTAG